jgi:hypothetical protein
VLMIVANGTRTQQCLLTYMRVYLLRKNDTQASYS